jgi:sortase A
VRTDFKIVRVIERTSFITGLLLLSIFAIAHIHRFVMLRVEMARFEARTPSTPERTSGEPGVPIRGPLKVSSLNTALWSLQRMKAYQATLGRRAEPLALLRISTLNLEVPVLQGTDEFTLNSGVGIIRNTSLPGQGGNIGIAGHRDGFFRSLKDIKTGDNISLVTITGTSVYVVDRIRITDPTDVSILRPRGKPSLTLVTCYPFYLVGPAPKRYIVEASLKEETYERRNSD